MRNQQLGLYALVLVLSVIMVLAALGGGLFNQSASWQIQWQHQAFWGLCHQVAERSFWINGQPMAVCSRCFGIYASFTGGWILLPLLSNWEIAETISVKKIALAVIIINFIDVIGNSIGLWQNTLVSRSLFGGFIGITASLLFSGDFFKLKLTN